jgi:diguanylate cyclase (GGDEF)-like protein/PAS domain S-box-containing protein
MQISDGGPNAEWFRQMANGSAVVFFVLRVHPDAAFEFLTDAVEDQIGCSAAEGLADPAAVLGLIDPEYGDQLAALLALTPGEETTAEMTWRHRDGRPVHARAWVQSRQRDDGSVILEGSIRDITQLYDAETDLRLSEQRYRLLAENAWEIIWTASLDGTINYISPAVERVRGFTPEEAMHQTVEETHPPESAARVVDFYRRLFAAIDKGEETPVFRGEQEYYRKDGSIMEGELQVIPHVDTDGSVVEILGVTRDISERKAFEAELTRLAGTDAVTGVWNRRHGGTLLAAELEQARIEGRPLSALMVDIDHFKPVNDIHGHQTGDRVLTETARRMLEAVRGADVVARWGGEEFVIMLRDCGLGEAMSIAEKIRAQIANTPFRHVGTVTVSVGAAELRPDEGLEPWLARADAALYDAKRSGRNTVRASS